jgi:hypothetical protein
MQIGFGIVREIEDQILHVINDPFAALTWLGRGDGGVEDWSELRAEAARAHNRHTAGYLLGIPLLADYLGEASSLLGIES